MRITKKIGGFILKQEFKLLIITISRADGKTEQPIISKNGENFIFKNRLFSEKEPQGIKGQVLFPVCELKRVIEIVFNSLKKDYKRICFSKGQECIFIDLWEK